MIDEVLVIHLGVGVPCASLVKENLATILHCDVIRVFSRLSFLDTDLGLRVKLVLLMNGNVRMTIVSVRVHLSYV